MSILSARSNRPEGFAIARTLWGVQSADSADTLAVLSDFFRCGMGELFEVVPKEGKET